jgi:hypothetical protein
MRLHSHLQNKESQRERCPKRLKDGEWTVPVMRGYRMRCCNCGLVHKVDFEFFENGIRFRARRESEREGREN